MLQLLNENYPIIEPVIGWYPKPRNIKLTSFRSEALLRVFIDIFGTIEEFLSEYQKLLKIRLIEGTQVEKEKELLGILSSQITESLLTNCYIMVSNINQ